MGADEEGVVTDDKEARAAKRAARIRRQRSRGTCWRKIEGADVHVISAYPDHAGFTPEQEALSARQLIKILALFDDEVLFRACKGASRRLVRAVLAVQVEERFRDDISKLK